MKGNSSICQTLPLSEISLFSLAFIKILISLLLLLCSHSPNDVTSESQPKVSIAMVLGAVRSSKRSVYFVSLRFYTFVACYETSLFVVLPKNLFGPPPPEHSLIFRMLEKTINWQKECLPVLGFEQMIDKRNYIRERDIGFQ